MLYRDTKRDAATERVTHDVGLLDPQAPKDDRHVVSHVDETDGPIRQRGAPMSIEVDRDHSAIL